MVGALSLGAGSSASSGTLLLRVKCGDCHFSVSVPLDVTYPMLHQKIAKKVRLFRGSEPASMHIKWVDQDGDEVSLKCDQDVEGMFEEAGELGLPFVTLIAKTG
jgi:cell division control protein 24